MSDTQATAVAEPEIGSYFVANYPPFSVWTREAVASRRTARSGRACRRVCRSGSTCTSRSAGSAATFVISASTRTRTRSRSSSIFSGSVRSGNCCARRRALVGPAAQLRLLRRRDALVSVHSSARRARHAAVCHLALERRRRDHVRVRAGHADGSQARGDSRTPGVTRLSLGVENFDDRLLELNGRAHRRPRSIRSVRVRALDRLSADQHRSHRRHAWRDGRELARLHCAHARARSRQRDDLPDGAAVQHDDQRRSDARDGPVPGTHRRPGTRGAAGCAKHSRRSSAPATRLAAHTRP